MTTPMDKLDSLAARLDDFRATNQAAIEQVREQTRLMTIKYIRMPLVIATGFTTGSTVAGDTEQTAAPPTPDQGFVWHVRHLVIEGLATGTPPDIVNILRQGRIVWQLNGNQFSQTWGRGEMRLNAGEIFAYSAVGTIASKTIIIHGTAEEVAAEQEGKFR